MRKLTSRSPKLALGKETLRSLQDWQLRRLCLGADQTIGCATTNVVQRTCGASNCASCSLD